MKRSIFLALAAMPMMALASTPGNEQNFKIENTDICFTITSSVLQSNKLKTTITENIESTAFKCENLSDIKIIKGKPGTYILVDGNGFIKKHAKSTTYTYNPGKGDVSTAPSYEYTSTLTGAGQFYDFNSSSLFYKMFNKPNELEYQGDSLYLKTK